MDPCIFLAVVELRSEDVFPVTVCPKVDRACGDDADEGWAETFEKGSWGFVVVDILDDVACFDEMVEEAASVVVGEGKG